GPQSRNMIDEPNPAEQPIESAQPIVDSPETQALGASPSAAPSAWRLPGGRYHVVGEIAHGGMGVVLRVIDVDVQRPLAVKVLLRDYERTAADRFLEEARITGQLQHPGI